MKNNRKGLSILLIMFLLVMVFSACSSTEAVDKENAGTKENEIAQGDGETSDSSTESEEIPELSVLSINTSDYADRPGIDVVEEKLGIKLVFTFIGKDTAVEKFNIMVQSNDLPDLVTEAMHFMDNSGIYRLGKEGVFLPLNDLIEEYGSNILKRWEENPAFEQAATAPDGNIYALPAYYHGLGQIVRSHLFIEKNFLENVGMDIPKTVDELYQFLKAVKEEDANGNGDTEDEIPLIGRENDVYSSLLNTVIMGAFTKVSVTDYRVINDGRVEYMPASDGFKEGLKFLAKLYQEGLLYSESFTIDRKTLWSLNENDPDVNTIATTAGHHGNAVCNWKSPRWKDYEVVGALQGPDGSQGHVPQDPGWDIQLKAIITSNCENPSAAMRLFDFMATEEGMRLAFWGVEGNDYELVDSGVDINGEPAIYRPFEEDELPENHVSGLLSDGWPTYQSKTIGRLVDPELGWQGQGDKFTSKYYENIYMDSLLPDNEFWPANMYFDSAALSELALLETDLKNAVDLAKTEFVMGVRDIDAEWDNYIDNLKSMGLDRYLEISQEQYDNNMKNIND